MFRCTGLAVAILTTSAAWASELPRYEIESLCRAAPTLQGDAKNTDRNCIRDEMQARGQLQQQWVDFDAGRREGCIQEESIGGAPSYVDLLTCLQM